MKPDNLIELATEVVSAYVSTNTVASSELPGLINQIHSALHRTATGTVEPKHVPLDPAVEVKKSVTPDYIICLEDGKKFKSLKRHLRTSHDLTPDEYRQKWGLGPNYPIVAPNYAKRRSKLAKKIGLGQKR